jgi:hypothetical protein
MQGRQLSDNYLIGSRSHRIASLSVHGRGPRRPSHPIHELGFASTYCYATVVVFCIPSADVHLQLGEQVSRTRRLQDPALGEGE